MIDKKYCFLVTLRNTLAIATLLFASNAAIAQKKTSAPPSPPAKSAPAAPAKPAATPNAVNHAPVGVGGPHAPATPGGTHGPTTGGPRTAAPGRGPTTPTVHTPGPTSPRPMGTRPGGPGPGGRPVPTTYHTVRTPGGNEVHTRSNGRPAEVRVPNRGMEIHHGLNGDRRVVVEHQDHTRVVVERGGRGYVQRPYLYHGREFGRRTYFYHGRPYDRFYRPYAYHGVYVHVYAPAYYYRPAFYGWVYHPWVTPVVYPWGWAGNPWYGYYGYYFSPYPVYPSASVWLTDYLISTSLAAAYEAQVQANAAAQAPPDASPLTPQVKDMIAAEVQRQIALENSESQNATQANGEINPGSSGIERMLTDNAPHVFVVGSSLDLVDAQGGECAVSQGDALQLAQPGTASAEATSANLVVLSSKGGQECRRGSLVSVAFADLQDMQNHMRETVDQGLQELQSKQSQGGLPPIPPSAAGEPMKAVFAADAPPPDPNVATEISQEAQSADAAEKEVLAQTAQNGAPPPVVQSAAPPVAANATPTTIAMAMTIDQVTAALGQPTKIADLGPKKIYYFDTMKVKVTFQNGKVVNIE